MNIDYSRQEIDQLIKRFNKSPNRDDYFLVNTWYSQNTQFPDNEYIICVYLFLLGANIKHNYIQLSRDDYLDAVKNIRIAIENSDTITSIQRKTYLDYGTKAGYYK